MPETKAGITARFFYACLCSFDLSDNFATLSPLFHKEHYRAICPTDSETGGITETTEDFGERASVNISEHQNTSTPTGTYSPGSVPARLEEDQKDSSLARADLPARERAATATAAVDWKNLQAPADRKLTSAQQFLARLKAWVRLFLAVPVKPHSVEEQHADFLPFQRLYRGYGCMLETRNTSLGMEVRLTIAGNRSLRKIINDMNREAEKKYGRTLVRDLIYDLNRTGIDDIPNVSMDRRVITFIPVLENSANRVRSGNDPKTSHQALLAEHNMTWVERPWVTIAAAAYRLAKGCPSIDWENWEKDKSCGFAGPDNGDLMKGYAVRTRQGLIYWDYVLELCRSDDYDDLASEKIALAGAPINNR